MIVANGEKNIAQRRIAVAERAIRSVVALAIAKMNVGDAVVVLLDEGDRVIVACDEVAAIERDLKPFRHRQRFFKTGWPGELVGIDEIIVIVHRDRILVAFAERDEALGFAENGGGADSIGSEGFCGFEGTVALGVCECLVEIDVVVVDAQAGGFELLADFDVVIHRDGEPPVARVFAHFGEAGSRARLHPPTGGDAGPGLNVAGHDFAFGNLRVLHAANDCGDELRIAGRRRVMEAEGFDAEMEAADRLRNFRCCGG